MTLNFTGCLAAERALRVSPNHQEASKWLSILRLEKLREINSTVAKILFKLVEVRFFWIKRWSAYFRGVAEHNGEHSDPDVSVRLSSISTTAILFLRTV